MTISETQREIGLGFGVILLAVGLIIEGIAIHTLFFQWKVRHWRGLLSGSKRVGGYGGGGEEEDDDDDEHTIQYGSGGKGGLPYYSGEGGLSAQHREEAVRVGDGEGKMRRKSGLFVLLLLLLMIGVFIRALCVIANVVMLQTAEDSPYLERCLTVESKQLIVECEFLQWWSSLLEQAPTWIISSIFLLITVIWLWFVTWTRRRDANIESFLLAWYICFLILWILFILTAMILAMLPNYASQIIFGLQSITNIVTGICLIVLLVSNLLVYTRIRSSGTASGPFARKLFTISFMLIFWFCLRLGAYVYSMLAHVTDFTGLLIFYFSADLVVEYLPALILVLYLSGYLTFACLQSGRSEASQDSQLILHSPRPSTQFLVSSSSDDDDDQRDFLVQSVDYGE